VSELARSHSPATVHKIHRVLSLVIDMAVKDGRLARNVAGGVNLPRSGKPEHRYLTHEQVDALATATGYPTEVSKHSSLDTRTNETYRLVVLFLAYTGVRFGEMAALRVRRLDLARNRAVVAESITQVQGQGLVWGTPKTHQRREVPIPRFLPTELAEHIKGQEPGRPGVPRDPQRPAAPGQHVPDDVHGGCEVDRRAGPAPAPVAPHRGQLGDRLRCRNEEEAPTGVSAGQSPFSYLYPRPDSNRRYRLERAAC
jgi:integrase